MRPSTKPALPIECFADIWCPFAYVGLVEVFAARQEVAPASPILVRAWPLEQINGSPLSASTVIEEAADLREQVAPDLFAGVDQRRFPASTLLALGLTSSAYRRGSSVGEQVSMELRRRLFEQGEDISDPEVLGALAAEHDLDLPSRASAAESVASEYALGRDRGVKGSPHFFAGSSQSFCPTLDVARSGEHLRLALERRRLHSWLAAALLDRAP